MTWLRNLFRAWLLSWLFLGWSVLCVSIGAAAMYFAVVGELVRRGIVR